MEGRCTSLSSISAPHMDPPHAAHHVGVDGAHVTHTSRARHANPDEPNARMASIVHEGNLPSM